MATDKGFTLVELLVTIAIAALLASIAVPLIGDYVDTTRVATATSDIKRIELAIGRFEAFNFGELPDSLADVGEGGALDPWGNPYRYLNVRTAPNQGRLRKDRNLVPINSDYDLYSMGPDGRSVPPLTARHSRDDIVRANNGSFVGVAEEY